MIKREILHEKITVHRQSDIGDFEAGRERCSVTELCRQHGMSSAAFYKWRSKYGGMDASLMAQMKELEQENARLKKMYADAQLRAEVVQETLAKKW